MGWKSVRDHYRIGHIVSVRDGQICVGSGYIPDIIVINADGAIVKRYGRGNDDLARYQMEMDADPELLVRLVAQEDNFDATVPVFTWGEDGLVIEKRAEAVGYPHPTTDGELQYENTHFAALIDAQRKALENARYGVEGYGRRLKEVEEEAASYRAKIALFEAAVRQLSAAVQAHELAAGGAAA